VALLARAYPVPGVRRQFRRSDIQRFGPWSRITSVGEVINDYTRSLGIEGDGRTVPDSSWGFWRGSTNLVTNGRALVDTSGWATVGAATTLNRVTNATDAPFGPTAFSASIDGSGSTDRVYYNAGVSLSAGTRVTCSVWVKATTGGDVGKSLTITAASISSTTHLYDVVTGLDITLPTNWTRYSLTITLVDPAEDLRIELGEFTDGSAWPAAAWLFTGAQIEVQPYATPYIDNGRTRARGYAILPTSVISTLQGWIACRLRLNQVYTDRTSDFYIFDVLNSAGTNSIFSLRYNATLDRFEFGGTGTPNQPSTFAAGDVVTLIVTWDSTFVSISLNGNSLLFARVFGTAGSGSLGRWFFGLRSDLSSSLDNDILWVAAGTGTLSDDDAASIHARGNTDDATNWPSLSAATFFWPADTDVWYVPTLATGTAYIDSATISSKTTPSVNEIAQFVESATISGLTSPSGSDVYTPPATVYTDTGTIAGKTTPTAAEIAQYVESATISSNTVVSSTDLAVDVDSGTISGKTTFSGTDLLAAVDAATISSATSPSATELAAYVDQASVTTSTSVSAAELHEIPDANTIKSVTSLSSSEIAAYVDSATPTSSTSVSATELHEIPDAGTISGTTTVTTQDTAQYVDSSIISGVSSLVTSDLAEFVDSASVAGWTTPQSSDIYDAVGSTVVPTTTVVISSDVSNFVDANTVSGITTFSGTEGQQNTYTDSTTISVITTVLSTEIAQYVDLTTVATTTSVSGSETYASAASDSGTPSTITNISPTDIAQFVDNNSISSRTSITANEQVAFVDSSTVLGSTSIGGSEIQNSVATDTATISGLTSISYVERAQYVESVTITGTTTTTVEELTTFVDSGLAGTVTTFTPSEVYTTTQEDSATVTTITTIVGIEFSHLVVVEFSWTAYRRWYHNWVLRGFEAITFRRWAEWRV